MELKIASSVKHIKEVTNTVIGFLNGGAVDESFLFDVRLALEEAVINAIKYGNKSNPQKEVTIRYDIVPKGVVISIEDEGEGFDYQSIPDPRTEKNLLRTGGRGLFLIRKLMDKVEFNEKGNKITMSKFF